MSQGGYPPTSVGLYLAPNKINDGYIYLRSDNVINDKIVNRDVKLFSFTSSNLSDYADVFASKKLIYNNNGSKIYK